MDKADIEAVKAANPILDVLRDLGLPAQNNRIRCLKPQNHTNGDRTPSVTIWPDRGQFKCWVCADVKGDVIDLVRLARGCTFREALRFLGRNTLGDAPLPPLRAGSDAGPSSSKAARRSGPPPHKDPAHRGSRPDDGREWTAQPQALPLGDPFPATHSPASNPIVEEPHPSAKAQAPASGGPSVTEHVPASPDGELEDDLLRLRILAALLNACVPVGGKVARYLQKRRIFKRTWDQQKLRMIGDYAGVSRKLESAFGFKDLERTGFFNSAGHLRFYRHKLLFPYLDAQGRAVYMQARAIDTESPGAQGRSASRPIPKELSMSGRIPLPYNSRLLNEEPGQIYLCEGVIDTLTLIEQGFPAVGVPGAANFKSSWAPLFRNKTVRVVFDPDAPGESGAAKTIEILLAHGVEAHRLSPPTGKDLNDWLRKG
jgi:DNA primase